MTELVTQSEARAKSLTRYFTGKACRNGHVAERYVSCGKCVECAVATVKRQCPSKEEFRRRHLWSAYKLRLEDYNRLLASQDDSCAICHAPFEVTPHVDHDHATGEVRGLLCHHCNLVLGHAKDNVETLSEAIRYLSR